MQQTDATTPSSISFPLMVGIVATIGFNLAPIALGFESSMIGCFIPYAAIMIALSFSDRRVLGYATVISACNPANGLVIISFSFLLAVLTILREFPNLGKVIRELGNYYWWWLLLAAFLFVGLSLPTWTFDARGLVSDVKNYASRLGFVAMLPLVVASTLRTPRDGVRAIFLLAAMSVSFFAYFYFFGQTGSVVGSSDDPIATVSQIVGNISLNFMRTSVCIPLAVLAVVALALGVCGGLNPRVFLAYAIAGLSVLLILILASTGSALAMILGMGVVALGYFGNRLSLGRIMLGTILFSIIGFSLYLAVFETENFLSKRMEEKSKQLDRVGIDRMEFWIDGIQDISENPIGHGWGVKTGHSEWLMYFLAYGWVSGACYFGGTCMLFLSLLRSLLRKTSNDPYMTPLLLVGLGSITVYGINSILDMLSANIGYYQIVWALILTSGTAAAIAEGSKSRLERLPSSKMVKGTAKPLLINQ